jgi:hypothetical protein
MQYAILSAPNAQILADEVNLRLSRGWILYGTPFTEKGVYLQAMTYVPAA